MTIFKPQFITDNLGNKVSVVLSINDYNNILEQLEDIEDIQLFDKANASNDEFLPIDEAFKIIELNRKNA